MPFMFKRIIDLSQPLYDGAPGAAFFPPPSVKSIKSQAADGFNLEMMSLTTHTGTHLDAPFHFLPEAKTIDALPLSDLMGTAVPIDLYGKKPSEPITAADLEAYGSRIGPGLVVLLCTGWGEKRRSGDKTYFESPYLTEDGARWLAARHVTGVGIDHFSISGSDYEQSVPPHLILLSAGIWIAEDLYLSRDLLEGGPWWVVATPLLIRGASGAPARVLAFEGARGGHREGLFGKVAVVTGAARGIGRATAERLAEEGADLVLCDVLAEPLQEVAEATRRMGRRALAIQVDVTSASEVRAMVDEGLRTFGHVDILVNNVGICPITPFEQTSEAEWDRVMAVNLKSAFLCVQAVVGAMQSQKGGRIVNICSVGAKIGGLMSGAHYVSSKAGLMGLTRSLARTYAASNITVNSVSPGPTASDMTAGWPADRVAALKTQIPLGRLGLPAEVAAAVAYLASDDASFVTGENLDVNGGLVMD